MMFQQEKQRLPAAGYILSLSAHNREESLLPAPSQCAAQAAAETSQNGSPPSQAQAAEALHPSFGLCVLSLEELECY